MKELIKKIESLRDNFESNYALEENAYTRACDDIIELVEQLRQYKVSGRSEQFCHCGQRETQAYSPCCSLSCWSKVFE